MYNSQEQQNTMNLLISPFNPNQSFDNTEPTYSYNQEQEPTLQYASITPPTINNNVQSHNVIYNNLSPSPQFEMMNNSNNNYANEFISNSPGSSSSNESNLVSPPQQYYPTTDFSWSESIGLTQPLGRQANNRRSSSVPPHFEGGDTLYNQFQVTPNMSSSKALPIKIPRINSHHHTFKPMNKEMHRRQLDEKLEKINFDDITVAELKEALRERGLSATGRKAELLNRLKREKELLVNRHLASPLHRRVTNLNISDSPTKHSRLFAPYSPPYSSRLASSVPESNTQFLNDQYMVSPSSGFGTNEEEQRKDIWDDQTLQDFLNQI